MITLVGGIPEPIGGITNYLYRLAIHFNSHIDQIIDLYPSANKWIVPNVQCRVRPAHFFEAIFWLFLLFYRMKSKKVYFNFSTPGSLLLLGLLPKRRDSVWYLTLHHGELEIALLKKSKFAKYVFRKVVNRFNSIGFINSNQRKFYLSHGVQQDRLKKITTYLPYVPNDNKNDYISNELSAVLAKYDKIVVASGYPTALYRHDWVLSYFEKNACFDRFALILCIYGADSEGRFSSLKEWVDRLPNAYLMESLSPGQFQSILASSDIYVRPTEKDSYGVAVVEALNLGLTVLASDACERVLGVHTFNRYDMDYFEKLLTDALHNRLESGPYDQNNGISCIADFMEVN